MARQTYITRFVDPDIDEENKEDEKNGDVQDEKTLVVVAPDCDLDDIDACSFCGQIFVNPVETSCVDCEEVVGGFLREVMEKVK